MTTKQTSSNFAEALALGGDDLPVEILPGIVRQAARAAAALSAEVPGSMDATQLTKLIAIWQ